MDASKIVIAGGSGFLGGLLRSHFENQGREVVVLSRNEGPGLVKWDGKTHGFWAQQIEGAAAVINMSGRQVTARWTEKNKREYEDSRIEPTRAIGEAVRKAQSPPKLWINSSAAGIYGDSGSREVTEATRPGTGFLAELCQKWEDACLSVETPGTRKVCLRTGVLLHPEAEFVKATSNCVKFGLTSPQGTGRQYVSWIHWQDWLKMVEWCLYEPVSGPLNATAPHPETNAEYMAALRRVYGRPALPPVPAPLVKMVVRLIGKEPELLLTGQRAIPEIAEARGFRFRFPELQGAVDDVLGVVPGAWRTA